MEMEGVRTAGATLQGVVAALLQQQVVWMPMQRHGQVQGAVGALGVECGWCWSMRRV